MRVVSIPVHRAVVYNCQLLNRKLGGLLQLYILHRQTNWQVTSQ